MLKIVLLAFCITFATAFGAHAQTSVTAGVASNYCFERLASHIDGPVANISVNHDAGNGISYNVWAQVGEEDLSNEIDFTVTASKTIGTIDTHVTGGVYLARSTEPVYVVIAGASVPVFGPVSLDLQVDHYEGGYESTVTSAAFSGDIGPVSLSLGKAFNEPQGLDPWFVRSSIALGEDTGWHLGARGYWGAGEGFTLEISRSF